MKKTANLNVFLQTPFTLLDLTSIKHLTFDLFEGEKNHILVYSDSVVELRRDQIKLVLELFQKYFDFEPIFNQMLRSTQYIEL